MGRMSSLLFAAVAIALLTVPTYASAAPELTIGGAKATSGTSITATSTNHIIKTSIGNLTCGTLTYHLEVTANTGSTVESPGIGAGTASNCFFKGTVPITVDDPTLILHSNVATQLGGNVTYVATLPKGLTCHYKGTIPGTYNSTGNTFHMSGSLTATPEACGTASTEGDFTLTSIGGAVVTH